MDEENKFLERLYQLKGSNKSNNNLFFMRTELESHIDEITNAKPKSPKDRSSRETRLLKKYSVMSIAGINRMVRVSSNNQKEDAKYFLCIEEMFHIIKAAHKSAGHGGIHKTYKELSKNFANVGREAITAYLSNCAPCFSKRKRTVPRKIVAKPIKSSDFNSRGQVNLIDMESKPDGEYKWILHYQDQRTKFSNLCALKSIEVTEVASSLLDIFLNFGPPHILESENGREFAGKVIIELKTMWPDVVIVHGGSCNPQGESSAEDVNDDVKEILMAWLLDNKTSKWSEGLKFIQFNKNRSYHCGINQSPYSAMFGYEPEVGISTSNIPKEILHGLQTEEDLTAINEIDIYTQTPELVYKSEDIPDMSGKIL